MAPAGQDDQAGPEVDVDPGRLGLGIVGGEQPHDGQDHAVQDQQATDHHPEIEQAGHPGGPVTGLGLLGLGDLLPRLAARIGVGHGCAS
jgi:hypothetical protein